LRLSEFDFDLPPELIAQEPAPERGTSRLLTLHRDTGAIADRRFADLPDLLQPSDLLVVNDTRVFAARLIGRRLPGGGAVECLLLRRLSATETGGDGPLEGGDSPQSPGDSPRASGMDPPLSGETWEALMHPGQRLKAGSRVEFAGGAHVIHGEVLDRRFHGRRSVRLTSTTGTLAEAIDALGHVPLPPYIKRPDQSSDRERYQTMFARARGSIAAPTAGLHFTPELIAALAARGIERASITLHVGYGTFKPIRTDDVSQHEMDEEHYDVSPAAADAISRALRDGRRIVATGTTTTRALESAVSNDGVIAPGPSSTRLFIVPGHRFRVVSALITNFHLPRSSLLLLVSAFAGRDHVLAAYRHAIAERYRFYSYGDAMLIPGASSASGASGA
jgi:S-adenosylmethionine:tRNA ribosyltransferase-isomerase